MELTEEARKKMEAFFRLDPDWWGKDIFVRSSERLGDLAVGAHAMQNPRKGPQSNT